MFNTANNDKIGSYIGDLIKQTGYNDRQFGIAYLEKRFGFVNEGDIPNIQNRICQIKKGRKGLQLTDLPVFAELLNVSIETILSAGEVLVPPSERTTNYTVAFSEDPKVWEAYIRREDNPFLNPDEFNKTIIDYALEAGNYKFLKHLMNSHHIWFVGDDNSYYFSGFGAGTDIKRRDPAHWDPLTYQMAETDDLRYAMIALAIKNNDRAILDELHAREIPLFYTVTAFIHQHLAKENLPSSPNVARMLDQIANSKKAILSYFFEAYEIKASRGQLTHELFFPFAGQVLDAMIKGKHKTNAIEALKLSITHNKHVQQKLQSMVDKSYMAVRDLFPAPTLPKNGNPMLSKIFVEDSHTQVTLDEGFLKKRHEKYIRDIVWRHYAFYPSVDAVAYYMADVAPNQEGFITNVVHVTASSSDPEIKSLIEELNRSYEIFSKNLKYTEE